MSEDALLAYIFVHTATEVKPSLPGGNNSIEKELTVCMYGFASKAAQFDHHTYIHTVLFRSDSMSYENEKKC